MVAAFIIKQFFCSKISQWDGRGNGGNHKTIHDPKQRDICSQIIVHFNEVLSSNLCPNFKFTAVEVSVNVAGDRIFISMHLYKERARSATTNTDNTRNIYEKVP